MVRTRRSLVWADPTFERQREGIGERPQLAALCLPEPMLPDPR
jgi:hypothetical protein